MRSRAFLATILVLVSAIGCASKETRGIADKRSNFGSFLPMRADPARDGLKAVKPYFQRADRAEITRAIERACDGRRAGSSVYDPKTSAGYYINCNPKNRQLLNGYVPVSASVRPHSR